MQFTPALNRFRQSSYFSKTIAACVIVVVAIVGYVFVATHAASPLASAEAEQVAISGPASVINDAAASAGKALQFGVIPSGGGGGTTTGGLLNPTAFGFMPYAYISWGDVNMTSYANASGVKNLFGAFINGANGCTPAWDGDPGNTMSSTTASTILTDINGIRAKGGDVAISFGGDTDNSDTDLADVCSSPSTLQAAYQSVIAKYSATHLNFDVEGAQESNSAGNARRVQALAALQKANPNLKVSLTIPVETTGLDAQGKALVQQMHDGGVVLSSIDIMSMEFGVSGAQAAPVESSAQGTVKQIQQIYGSTTADAWKALGIIVEIGTGHDGKTFSLQDAQSLKTFAAQNSLGTLSMWSVNRDFACDGKTHVADQDNCSQVTQSTYQYSSLMH